ncbi:four helix bundle protein [soil metagenome]
MMQSTKGYHKLLVCLKLRELIKEIYLITEKFPKTEIFGLTSQVRRAIVSVLLNIVEGQRRESKKDFLHFLDIADASLVEVEACLEITLDLKYLSHEEYEIIEEKRKEIAYMLVAFIKSLSKPL